MLDMLAAAALNGAMVVAVANPPKHYVIQVGAADQSEVPKPMLDCSKLQVRFGNVTVDTSLPAQPLPMLVLPQYSLSPPQAQALDAGVASQLASGTHGPVSVAASGTSLCGVSVIAADPLSDVTATSGSLRLAAKVVTVTSLPTPMRNAAGYETIVLVSQPPEQGCRAVIISINDKSIDLTGPFVEAQRGETGMLFPPPIAATNGICEYAVATPGAEAKVTTNLAIHVTLKQQSPLYLQPGTQEWDTTSFRRPSYY